MLKLTVLSAFCDSEPGVGPAYVADYPQGSHAFLIFTRREPRELR
jgi:hypothetical protein